MSRHSYSREAITRALTHHNVEGRSDFAFHGIDGQGRWRVRLHSDEVEALGPREAWLVCQSLSAGRNIEQRISGTGQRELTGQLVRGTVRYFTRFDGVIELTADRDGLAAYCDSAGRALHIEGAGIYIAAVEAARVCGAMPAVTAVNTDRREWTEKYVALVTDAIGRLL